MVIDTSAIVAILFAEPEARRFADAIEADGVRLMSAGSVLETSLVVESTKGEEGGRELDLLLHKAQIETVDFTPEQLAVGRRAYRQFGKGRHPASLNYGDCFGYALSKTMDEPLLFKGDDFSKTDVVSVF